MLPLISDAHRLCYILFERLVNATADALQYDEHQMQMADVHEEFSKYKIWAGNVGAAHSGVNHEISLDYRLREASVFKMEILDILDKLGKNLSDSISIVRGEKKPFEDQSNDSDEGSPNSSVSEADDEDYSSDSPWEVQSEQNGYTPSASNTKQAQDEQNKYTKSFVISAQELSVGQTPDAELPYLIASIKLIINCLYRLPIRKPAPFDRLGKRTSFKSSCYEAFDVLYVQDRFRELNSEVAARLGRMITRRRQLLRYWDEHSRNLEASQYYADPSLSTSGPVLRSKQTESDHSGVRKGDKNVMSQAGKSGLTFRSKATTLYLLNPPTEVVPMQMDFMISDTPSIATSIASSYAGNSIQVDIPPRPKGENGEELQYFQCPYCMISKKISTARQWKKHVLEDLQPYVCTFPNCELQDSFFKNQDEWYSHELGNHRSTWFCNTQTHNEYGSWQKFVDHMKQDHSSNFDLDRFAVYQDMFRRPPSRKDGVCNLCLHEAKDLRAHLSRHLRQIALFALPRTNETNGSNEAGYLVKSSANNESEEKDKSKRSSTTDEESNSLDLTDSILPAHIPSSSDRFQPRGATMDSASLPSEILEHTNLPETDQQMWDGIVTKFTDAREGRSAEPPFLSVQKITDKTENEDQSRIQDWLEVIEARFKKSLLSTRGPDDPLTLQLANALGFEYNKKGRLAEAETMYQRALEGFDRIYGIRHPLTRDTILSLGLVYENQGYLAKAEVLFDRALKLNEDLMREFYPMTLDKMASLGQIFKKRVQLSKAEVMYNRALAGYKKIFGEDDPVTLNTIQNLGEVYESQGRLIDAENAYNSVLTVYKKVLSEDHPSTMDKIYSLGLLNKKLGRRIKAQAMLEQARAGYEKSLGKDHPSTLDIARQLELLTEVVEEDFGVEWSPLL